MNMVLRKAFLGVTFSGSPKQRRVSEDCQLPIIFIRFAGAPPLLDNTGVPGYSLYTINSTQRVRRAPFGVDIDTYAPATPGELLPRNNVIPFPSSAGLRNKKLNLS